MKIGGSTVASRCRHTDARIVLPARNGAASEAIIPQVGVGYRHCRKWRGGNPPSAVDRRGRGAAAENIRVGALIDRLREPIEQRVAQIGMDFTVSIADEAREAVESLEQEGLA